MEASQESYEHVLKAHLDVNPRSWAALQERGVDEQTPLRLDFEYTAPGEAETRSLMRFLRTSTDYEFKGGSRTQADGKPRWLVLGTTSPMALSLDALNAWVTQMTAYGRDHGPARFDGWGARTPKSAPAGKPVPAAPKAQAAAPAGAGGDAGPAGRDDPGGEAGGPAAGRDGPEGEAGGPVGAAGRNGPAGEARAPAGAAGRGDAGPASHAGSAAEADPAGQAGSAAEADPAEADPAEADPAEAGPAKGLLGRLLRGRRPR
jgi:hypothetical protein